MRICSECKEKMFEGYCIEAGLEYYCSDECLHKHYTEEEYLEMYAEGNGDSYYTEWEEDEEEFELDLKEKRMTEGIRLMKELGFIDTTDKQAGAIVKMFTKYDEKGLITDIINYFYSKETGVEVFTNNLRQRCGSRLDKELLNAVLLNFNELEEELIKELENET